MCAKVKKLTRKGRVALACIQSLLPLSEGARKTWLPLRTAASGEDYATGVVTLTDP